MENNIIEHFRFPEPSKGGWALGLVGDITQFPPEEVHTITTLIVRCLSRYTHTSKGFKLFIISRSDMVTFFFHPPHPGFWVKHFLKLRTDLQAVFSVFHGQKNLKLSNDKRVKSMVNIQLLAIDELLDGNPCTGTTVTIIDNDDIIKFFRELAEKHGFTLRTSADYGVTDMMGLYINSY